MVFPKNYYNLAHILLYFFESMKTSLSAYITHFLGCFLLSISLAQAQVDTEFWFAAPDVTTSHADRPIFLRIATFANATTVTISQPANAGFTPIVRNIPANSGETVELTSSIGIIETQPTAQIVSTGLRIVATNPISVYYEVLATGSLPNNFPLNPEIYGLKGKNALGQNFLIPGQQFCYNAFNSTESVDIVASEDNTTIQFTPSTELVGSPSNYQAGATYSVTLNKGQTFSLRPTTGNENFSMRGTQITSNKPIAVTISDDSINRDGSQDLIGDQLFPITKCGKEYIVLRGLTGANQDRIYILGTKNNTALSINGTSVGNINAKQTYELNNVTNDATYISASDTVYVMHLTGHQGFGSGIESAMSVLPTITGCVGTRDASFFKSTDDDFMMLIVTEDANKGNFSLNGNTSLITASDFTAVPNKPGWVYTRKSFTNAQLVDNDNHRLTNSSGLFHLGILLAYRNNANNIVGSSYAFFSNYDSEIQVDLGADKEICNGGNVTLNAGLSGAIYAWTKQKVGEATITPAGSSQTLNVTETSAGDYKFVVTVTKGNCSDTDEIIVKVLPAVATPSITGLANKYCKDATAVTLAGSPTSASSSFTIDGSPATSFNPATLSVGNHIVRYTYINTSTGGTNCSAFTEQTVEVVALPTLSFVGLAGSYCANASAVTLQASPAGGTFKVNNVTATTFNPATLGVGNHTVNYSFTDANGCTNSVNQSVSVLAVPVVSIAGLADNYCVNSASITLTGSPTGGTFKINNVTATVFNPTVLGIGQHTVNYSVTAGGCTASIDKTVTVLPLTDNQCFTANFFIPDLFSPNGDKSNDAFLVAGSNIKTFKLKLFDRFGDLVYETNSFADASTKGWDGKKNGKDQPVGVYTWQIEGTLLDGSVLTYKGAKRGAVNLIR